MVLNEGVCTQQRQTSNFITFFSFDESSCSVAPSARSSLVSTPQLLILHTLHPGTLHSSANTSSVPLSLTPYTSPLPVLVGILTPHTPTSTQHSHPNTFNCINSPCVDLMRHNSKSIPSIPSPRLSASLPRLSPTPQFLDSQFVHSPSPSPSRYSGTSPPSQFGFFILSENSDVVLSLLACLTDFQRWSGLSSFNAAQAELTVVVCVEEHLMLPTHTLCKPVSLCD
ncbi:hypothetical protein BLNAU_6649 [Blattamonas nauphoetae]|uniref:Uncharacterized protein n=1 Tax=Blattamonas nauphoetae TaxID=2049346 RepID=A0ABQ9Y3T8_9EUKA|nr:hypothetical protein BLNAU_6649 [Blattamonas nauphoetae]